VPPLFANGWYFRHCQKVMAKIRAQTNSREAYLAALTVKGGSGGAAIIVIGTALVAIAIIGILAAVALPAYQDYTKRAKVADAMVMGRTTAQAVVEFYRQTREIPSRLEDLPGAPAMSPSVSEVSIDPNSGQVRLLVKDVGTLLMTPSVNGSEVIVSCTAADVKKSWLPASCRD
jgi:type II secretory pathway pseudopilin PulG